VSECDRESSTMKRPWPTKSCHAMENEKVKTELGEGLAYSAFKDIPLNVLIRKTSCHIHAR